MEFKTGQQADIIEHTKEAIISAEEKRKKVRFKHNFNELGKGHIQVLANDEFVNGLVDYFGSNPHENLAGTKNIIIHLGKGALVEDRALRERALAILSPAAEFYVRQKEKDGISTLADVFYSWLEYETELLPGFTIISKRIEETLEWLLQSSFWNKAEKMFLLLGRIQSGSLEKSAAIRSISCTITEKLAQKRIIEKLTDDYLLNNDQQQATQNILVSMGEKSAIYQLNRVIHSHSRQERLALIDLIPAFGDLVIPILVACQKENPPWAVVRNIVCIISEIGADKYYPIVKQYLHHPDERVQHEMICCVMKIGGQDVQKRLFEALCVVNDRLKTHIIRLLVEQEMRDDDILQALCELAQKSNTFSIHSSFELLSAIIYGLKAFPCNQSLEVLEKLYAEYEKRNGTEQILLNISEAQKVINPQVRHSLQALGGFQDVVSFASDPLEKLSARGKVRKIEEEMERLITAGNMKQAEQFLYAESVAAARVKDFSAAEMLRDRLLEINPLLLSEVVQLGELIEAQKNSSITSHHIEIWNELYEEMTTEEFNALYYCLRQENYRKDDVIVNIGDIDTNLYFLNSGHINLSCNSGGAEVFLKKMQPGDVLGSEQFFFASVWTVSLKALSEVQLQVLERKALEEIAEDYPGVENTLRTYCRNYLQIPELLKMSGDDRREYPRYRGRLLVRSILLDPYGNKGKRSFKGELIDVSQGGLAFTVKISNKKNARLLLGRQILTTIAFEGRELPQCSGVIVSVRVQDPILQDYSVHVKLSKTISDDIFRQIISLSE